MCRSCEGEIFAASGARAGGDDEGGCEDERASGSGAGAEALAEQEDSEQRSDEGLHVEQDPGLGGGNLGESPVPEQGGGGGAEQAAGGEGEPGLERDGRDGRRAEGLAIEDGDDEEEHHCAGGDSVGGDGDGAVAQHQALVDEDPGEGNDQREDDEHVSAEGGAGCSSGVTRAECNERGSKGGEGESEPAGAVHALVGEERGGNGEQNRQGANHQRGVGDGGEGEAGELDEELERDPEEGGEQKEAPVGAREAGPVEQEQGRERKGGEEEAVEDHCADVHLGEGDLAEEEAAAPERAGESAGCEAESAVFYRLRHIDGRS